MKRGCFIRTLAELLAARERWRAIFVDPRNRSVSVACHGACEPTDPGAGSSSDLAELAEQHFEGCARAANQAACAHCGDRPHDNLPDGVRLVHIPESGWLLEKPGCPTADRLWRWRPLPLVRVKTIELTDSEQGEWKQALALALTCGGTTLAGFILENTGAPWWAARAAYAAAYVTGSWHPAEEAFALLRKRVLDVHFLMLCVAVGAALIGHWWEGAILMFLFSLSGAMEDYAMERTERAIHSLFKASPKEASVRQPDGSERKVPVESLAPGMQLVVRPGEQFPVDGRVATGTSAADESNLTGESIPIEKAPGERVLAGTMNLWGVLECDVDKPASESALSRILHLIQEARESKAPAQRFTDRFGSAYTYGILGLCLLMFSFWHWGAGLTAKEAFYRAMTLLVVASPCALVLSIPSAILAGIAAGARRGILFRGGIAIERLAQITRVALDKTGTLTTGHLQLRAVEPTGGASADLLLAEAAALAGNSTHPVSQALVRAANERKLTLPATAEFRSLAGMGLQGTIAGTPSLLGRRSLFANAGWVAAFANPEPGMTEVLLSSASGTARFVLADEVRTSSRPLLEKLARRGLQLTMLSGDRPEAAAAVAERVGLRDVAAGLQPEDKVARIKAWMDKGELTAMVGDGVNDAPSLAVAHVGIAMGLRGTDAALEQADIVLMKDRLDRFYIAYELSRRARRIIRQNLAISLGSVVLLVAAAFSGSLPLTLGVIGHEGSTVIVVLNSLRLLLMRFEEDRGEEAAHA